MSGTALVTGYSSESSEDDETQAQSSSTVVNRKDLAKPTQREQPQAPTTGAPNDALPPDLARELRRQGVCLDAIDLVSVNARTEAQREVHAEAAAEVASARARVRARTATATGTSLISKEARRRHQITALAADALARVAAEKADPVLAARAAESARRGAAAAARKQR